MLSKRAGKIPPCRLVHRKVAAVLIIFAVLHMANHFGGLVSASFHVSVMERLRMVYRTPLVEATLLACVLVHIASGVALAGQRWKMRSGAMAWLQAISGGYLALFLVIHVAAVLYGRYALGLDTNFYFAAAGLQVWPYGLFFAPYYFFAVLSLFVHIGCGWSRSIARSSRVRVVTVTAFTCMGAVASTLIVASLSGLLHHDAIPQEYLNTFQKPPPATGPVAAKSRERPAYPSVRGNL